MIYKRAPPSQVTEIAVYEDREETAMRSRYKKNRLKSQLFSFIMILSMMFQPVGYTLSYAEEYMTEAVYQETEEKDSEVLSKEYEEIMTEGTEEETSAGERMPQSRIAGTETTNIEQETVDEKEVIVYDLVCMQTQGSNMASGDEGAVFSEASGVYQPGYYAAYASMTQEEAKNVFINALLRRVGKGYSLSNPDNANYYACNTLIAEAFEELGIDIQSILGGSGWGNTSDWKRMLDTHSVGDLITFNGIHTLTFKIVGKDTTILGNPAAFSEPGTIILWMEPGESTGHLGVSLGYFERVTDGLEPAWNAAAIQTKTGNAVREHLIRTYGADRNQMYGNNQLYGLPNVQVSSEYIGTDVGIRGDTNGNILAYSGPYNGIFKVDALNTTYGVSVNNFFTGKSGSTVAYALAPADPPVREGYVYFTKHSERLNLPLKNASFAIYNSKENAEIHDGTTGIVKTVITDESGNASVSLQTGRMYYAVESAAPEGHISESDKIWEIYLDSSVDEPTMNISVTNREFITGTVKVVKTDALTHIPLSGAEFSLYEWSENFADYALVGVLTDEDNGNYTLAGYTPRMTGIYRETDSLIYTQDNQGRFKLIETGAPEHYIGDWSKEFVLTEDGMAVSFEVENVPRSGKLSVTKEGYDFNGNTVLLSDAEFCVYASKSDAENMVNEVTVMITGSDGKAVSNELSAGYYWIRETKAPEGYKEDNTVYGGEDGCSVGWESDVTIIPVHINTPESGFLQIEKIDSLTGNMLDGAVYTVYSDSACINAAGEILVSDGLGSIELPYGIYWMRETCAPYGYQLDHAVYGPYTVGGPEGDVFVPQIKDQEQRIEISLTKHAAEIGESEEKEVTLEGAVFELRAADDIVHPDGTTGVVYASGEVVTTLVTDKNGWASVQKDDKGNWLHCGTYELIEVKAPKGYVLDKTKYAVDARYDSTQATVEFAVHDVGMIKNKTITQPVVLHKYTSGNQSAADKLPGVGFTFYRLSDVCEANHVTDYHELPMNGNGIDTAKLKLEGLEVVIGENGETELFSDINGEIHTVPLAYGEYLVVETSTDIYHRAGTPFTVTIPTVQTKDTNGDQVELHDIDYEPEFPIEISVVNQIAQTYLYVEKLDAETGRCVRNANAQFQIMDANGNPVVQYDWNGENRVETDIFTTNAEGYFCTWQELKAGEYTLHEIKAPDGYVKGRPISFSVRADGIWFEKDGGWYLCKNRNMEDGTIAAVITAENVPITAEISKSDITTGKEIAGAVLTIYKKDSNGAKGEVAVYRSEDGIEIPAVWTSNGTKTVIKRLPAGDYILEETIAPINLGYVKAEDVAFTVRETGEVQRAVMKDDYTKVHISKNDITTGQAVSGAQLQIIDAGGNVYAEWTSDGREQVFEYMPVGIYTLAEVHAPTEKGYVHAEAVTFEVCETGEIQHVEMKNDYTKVQISKIDAASEEELAGALLQLMDKNGEIIREWISSDVPQMIEYLPVGEYILREAGTPDGYVTATDIYFEVRDTANIQKITMRNGKTMVEIVKKDAGNGNNLAGATLSLTDKETGEEIERWISGTKPHIITGLVPKCTYVLTEISAPDGYKIAKSMEFSVPDSTRKLTVIMNNILSEDGKDSTRPDETEEIEEVILKSRDVVILGVEDFAFWWGIALLISGLLVLAHAFWYAKKRREMSL